MKTKLSLRSKEEVWHQRWLSRLFPSYASMWTTWDGTIFYPASTTRPVMHVTTIRHENVHRAQQAKYGWTLFLFLYCWPPLIAYWRVKFELEAYLVNIQAGRMSPEEVVQTLWRYYAWPLPKPAMRSMLKRLLDK